MRGIAKSCFKSDTGRKDRLQTSKSGLPMRLAQSWVQVTRLKKRHILYRVTRVYTPGGRTCLTPRCGLGLVLQHKCFCNNQGVFAPPGGRAGGGDVATAGTGSASPVDQQNPSLEYKLLPPT